MQRLATIYGGSGFVGRYIAQRLAKAGWRVRVAVRRPNEAVFVRMYGSVGQVEPVLANIRDDASTAVAMQGADAVINCVGTFDKGGKNNFDAVQAEGAERIARLAAEGGVGQMVHISSIGADATSESLYSQSKARGEAAVQKHMPNAVILRPSVVFGAEDAFFNRFAKMAATAPVIPLVGPNTRFQPVYVDDVAAAAALAAEGKAAPGIYELGGPEAATFRELIQLMLGVIKRRALIPTVPFFIGRIMGWSLDLAQTLSLGLFSNSVLTRDQVRSLAVDNVVSGDLPGFAELGIEPTAMDAILPTYLWRFRPGGQYAEIKESAQNLKPKA